jgi:hypothetical protein
VAELRPGFRGSHLSSRGPNWGPRGVTATAPATCGPHRSLGWTWSATAVNPAMHGAKRSGGGNRTSQRTRLGPFPAGEAEWGSGPEPSPIVRLGGRPPRLPLSLVTRDGAAHGQTSLRNRTRQPRRATAVCTGRSWRSAATALRRGGTAARLCDGAWAARDGLARSASMPPRGASPEREARGCHATPSRGSTSRRAHSSPPLVRLGAMTARRR